MLRLISINSKREPKPSGKKKNRSTILESTEDVEENESLPDDYGYYDERGVALSQANKFAGKQKRKKDIPFVDSFTSSNLDALAYDPDKKQMWVRFKGGDVYTYFDVPIKIYRGFWSAPSKGHYFWEKIRKNKKIKYQRLTAGLHWIKLGSPLNAGRKPEANIADIANSFKKKAKKKHPDWNWCSISNDGTQKRVGFEKFYVDLARYQDKVRINITDKSTNDTRYFITDLTDTREVAQYILDVCEQQLSKLNSSSSEMDNQEHLKDLIFDIEHFLEEGLPELTWSVSFDSTANQFYIHGNDFVISFRKVPSGAIQVRLDDLKKNLESSFSVPELDLKSAVITEAMRLILQKEEN